MAAHRAVARHLDFAFELAVRVEYPQTRIAVDEIGEHQVAVDNVQCGKHVVGPRDQFFPGAAVRRARQRNRHQAARSEEHTSELQSLMRISYAVFCLKKKNNNKTRKTQYIHTHNK